MNIRIHSASIVPADEGVGSIEIPIEKIVNGEVVTVATKAIPMVDIPKESNK